MSEGGIVVRPFDPPRDLPGAYRSYVSSFHHSLWPIIDYAEPKLVMDIIMAFALVGDFTFVVEIDGEARAFAVGAFSQRVGGFARAAFAIASMAARVSSGYYRMEPVARRTLVDQAVGEIQSVFSHPPSPAEGLLLVSQKEYRGGIGTALMDTWVEEVRRRGFSRTTLSTDTTLGWKFFESYGCRRIKELDIKSYRTSLPGEKVTGYIYELEV